MDTAEFAYRVVSRPFLPTDDVSLKKMEGGSGLATRDYSGPVDALVAQALDDPTSPRGDVASHPSSIEAATWASRLRPRQRSDGDARDKSGEM